MLHSRGSPRTWGIFDWCECLGCGDSKWACIVCLKWLAMKSREVLFVSFLLGFLGSMVYARLFRRPPNAKAKTHFLRASNELSVKALRHQSKGVD